MKVSFYNADGGNHLCDLEKEDINTFIVFLRNLDTINLYIAKGYSVYGKIDEMTFDVEHHNEGIDERLVVNIKEIK